MATGTANQMKQVQKKHLSICITKCVWSPKMDLLLTANSNGQVSLYRHQSLQRVWQVSPGSEHPVVTGLAWRPDGNLIAVSCNSGLVMLLTLETGTEVHSFEVPESVTSLAWQQHCVSSTTGQKDVFSEYMTPLPASDKWFSESNNSSNSCSSGGGGDPLSWQNSHILDNQLSLNMLVVGTVNAKVFLYAFGLVHCAVIDLTEKVSGAEKILDAQCSHNMNMLSVVLERRNEITCTGEDESVREVFHVACDMSVISEHHKELYLLARKYSEIQSLFNYSTEAISQLREVWEKILLEMDTKLDAYSGKKETGEVSADFLDLLVFGYATPEFYMFLSNRLSEKGLKKLRQTVELSYINMHKLVVKQLEAVGQGLVFVISQVLGMARTHDRFGLLGVEEDVVTSALKEAGAFLLKTGELQQVIGMSMRDFVSFIKWLTSVHLRVSNTQVPQEIAKTTQQEIAYILGFLHDTLEEVVIDKNGKRHRKFRLESVGQFLKDENLKSPQQFDNNPWIEFLELHPEMHKQPLILPQRRDTSLVQEYSKLSEELLILAKRSVDVISKRIAVSNGISLFKYTENSEICISQKSNPALQKMNTLIIPKTKSQIMYFFQWDTDINKLYNQIKSYEKASTLNIATFTITQRNLLSPSNTATSPSKLSISTEPSGDGCEGAPIIAGQFYTKDIVSVLVQDFDNTVASLLIQVPVSLLEENMVAVAIPENCSVDNANLEPIDLSKDLTSSSVCQLNVSAGLFGVSGERKVAVVIANHRRTVQLYEMELDDDDDEECEDENADASAIISANVIAEKSMMDT